ncbi:DUF5658 family protein [Halomonas sp. SSL-5]|uniref:DUF5658 family protein n=1 Tax=Halomonas sp. SSL-5 TaxID=3065855 RepID=UPI002739602D|nr:DUF5658 family protein [Halomonas sp. SSL-5]MDY7116606.1 DUF5658 family protein [Halomonas sp. SSL-5]
MTPTLIAAVTMALAALADTVTTVGALRRGAREANPVLRWLMDKLGPGWVPVKLAPVAWAGWAAWQYPHDVRLALVLAALSAVYAGVAVHNHRLHRED